MLSNFFDCFFACFAPFTNEIWGNSFKILHKHLWVWLRCLLRTKNYHDNSLLRCITYGWVKNTIFGVLSFTIFAKSYILDVWQGFEYRSVICFDSLKHNQTTHKSRMPHVILVKLFINDLIWLHQVHFAIFDIFLI